MPTMKNSSTGSSTPLITCAAIMMPNRFAFGSSTMTADSTRMAVMMPRYVGASAQLRSLPRSQPNASQMALDVMPGSTHAAKNDAPIKPAPNSACAYCPTSGASAMAASSAPSTTIPAGYSTAPVTRIMNQLIALATIEPVTVSMRWYGMSFSRASRSTTLLCAKKIIHGAMVVPTSATMSDR